MTAVLFVADAQVMMCRDSNLAKCCVVRATLPKEFPLNVEVAPKQPPASAYPSWSSREADVVQDDNEKKDKSRTCGSR